jgi:hypothetical protein
MQTFQNESDTMGAKYGGVFVNGEPKPDQYSKLTGCTSKYPFLVGITTESGNFGTGILISANFVLTCHHVLDDSPSAEVISGEGCTSARVQKVDDSLDLALLKLTRPISARKATFTDCPLRPGTVLLAVGVQETPGESNELSVAEIELKFRNKNDAAGKILDIQLEGGARPGYSGGPVVVEKGGALRCVGVMRFGGSVANITNAIGLASIRAFVADYIPELPEDTLGTNAGVNRRLLILAAILFGTVGTIAGWHYLGSVNTASDQPIPAIKPPISLPQSPKSKDTGDPDVEVWVNTSSHVYHCPGERWYGKTRHGEYMAQAEAQKKGNIPAYEKVCE